MSHKTNFLWNYKMKLYIEDECFVHVLFHFTWWCGGLEINAMKLSIKKNNLIVLLNVVDAPPYVLWVVAINYIYSIPFQYIRHNHLWFNDQEMYLILSLNASATAPKYMRLEIARLVLWDMNKKWFCFIFWDGRTIWDLNQINFFTSD
jgi:hypothetical protein